MKTTIFCYGTLQQPHTQRELIGRELSGQFCRLLNHKVTLSVYDPTDGNTYPAIEFEPFAVTYGHAYKVTAEELTALDDYETELYVKKQMEVISTETGETINALVYIPTDYETHRANTYPRSMPKYERRAREEKQKQTRAQRIANQTPRPTRLNTFKTAFKAAFNLRIFAACLFVKILIELI